MAWVYLAIAGLLEIGWAFAMKQSHGFTRMVPVLITIVGMIGSFGFLAQAMRTLPLGTAYTIWTGIGAVGAFVIGIVFLGEQVNAMRIAAATMIVAGLITLKVA
jgi:quaternary ammonium compound-resistance protein SugE